MTVFQNMMPGLGSARTASHRHVFLQHSEKLLAGGRLIDGDQSRDTGNTGNLDVLRAGTLMGKITLTGLYAPSIVGVLASAYTSGGTTLTVSAAVATELDRLLGQSGTAEFVAIGPPSANGTVAVTDVSHSAINTRTGAITVSDLGASKVAGTLIAVKDGRQLPATFISDLDGYGVKVTDADGANLSVVEMPRFPVWGMVDSAQLLPVWPSDTSIRQWIVDQLVRAGQGQFVFNHLF